MKIVINIDQYVLEHCKRHIKENYANRIEKTIVNGVPLEGMLDNIRGEILEYIDDLNIANEICDIFDKYKTEDEGSKLC